MVGWTDGRTDGRTDRQTAGNQSAAWTHPLTIVAGDVLSCDVAEKFRLQHEAVSAQEAHEDPPRVPLHDVVPVQTHHSL